MWALPNAGELSSCHSGLACVSQKSRKLCGPEKPFQKLRPAYSVELVFSYVVKIIKIDITAKFRDTEHLRFEDTKRIMSPEKFRDFRETGPWSLFLEILENFSAWKASCPSVICLFWNADLLTCFKCKKNQEDCEFWWLRTSAWQKYKGNCGTRSRPDKFRDFRETEHWLLRRL